MQEPQQIAESVPWLLATMVFFGSALASWGLTEAIKKTALARLKYRGMSTKEAKKRLWWTPLLVLLSMLVGFGVGCGMGSIEWTWYYGGMVGLAGGVLATFAVGLLKGNIQAFLERKRG